MQETTTMINNIKVTVRFPERVSEPLKQEKINYIYDLLKPKQANQKEKS